MTRMVFAVAFALAVAVPGPLAMHAAVAPDLPFVDARPEVEERAGEHEALPEAVEGRACYYADFFVGRRTASGDVYTHDGFTAAHRTLPLGTVLEVESLATGRKVRVRVNDRGPFKGGFLIDLSKSAAMYLGIDQTDNRRVVVRVLASPDDSAPPQLGPVVSSDHSGDCWV